MKKFMKITLFLLVVAGIGYFSYTHIRKTSVLLNVIHVDADSAVKIGIHDLATSIVRDALFAPSYYWENSSFSTSDPKKEDPVEDRGIGVNLTPYSLVFYTMKEVQHTLFTTLTIDDLAAFENYITAYAKEKSSVIVTDSKGYKYLTLKKSKLIVAWNTKKVAVAITPKVAMDKVTTVFEDVLLKNRLISDQHHPMIQTLSSTANHMVYTTGKNTITIDFNDGEATIAGTLYTEKPNTYPTHTTYPNVSNAALQLYFDANFDHKAHKVDAIHSIEGLSFFTKNNINGTDFADHTTGFFNLAIQGTTTQQDTIISYEYDDNFEKIALKKVQEKTVPNMVFHLGKKNKSLLRYLHKQSAIQDSILTAIPYYTIYTKEDASYTSFTTSTTPMLTKKVSHPSFFNFKIHFKRLKKALSIPMIDEINVPLDRLHIQAKQIENANTINIEGKLLGINTEINIISQLFFGLQKNTLHHKDK